MRVRTATLQKEAACLKGFSMISQGFFQFQNATSSFEHNPFAERICSNLFSNEKSDITFAQWHFSGDFEEILGFCDRIALYFF